jgi:RNA polymerase sigma factor (sigma-70 family)
MKRGSVRSKQKIRKRSETQDVRTKHTKRVRDQYVVVSSDELPIIRRVRERYALLTDDDFRRLFHACHHSSSEHERTRARTVIACSNIGLVLALVNEFTNRGVPLADLVQEGFIALYGKSIDKFSFEFGCKFSTYAPYWIRQAMSRILMDANTTKPIRVPIHAMDAMRVVKRTISEFQKLHGREPDFDELLQAVRETGIKTLQHIMPKQLKHYLEDDPGISVSTDSTLTPDGDDRTFLESFRPSAPGSESHTLEMLYETRVLKQRIEKALHSMSEQRRDVIVLYYGWSGEPSMSYAEIGEIWGVSRQRIQQIQKEALMFLSRTLRKKPSEVATLLSVIGDISNGPIVESVSVPQPSESLAILEGEGGDELLENHFACLSEHATDWRGRGDFVVLAPAHTLIARKRYAKLAGAEQCIDAFVSKRWVERTPGMDAVKLTRLDKMPDLAEKRAWNKGLIHRDDPDNVVQTDPDGLEEITRVLH